MQKRYVAFVFILTIGASTTVRAEIGGTRLGGVCIEGVTRVETSQETDVDGKWVGIKLSYNKPAGAASSAVLGLFDRPLPKFDGHPTCKEAIAQAKNKGVN